MDVWNRPLARSRWNWTAGVLAGLITQLFFVYTAVCLFFFLKDGGSPEKPFRPILNILLTLQFAIPHSLLLWPPASRALQKWIPKAFYGSFYCVVTCLSLVLIFRFWTTSAVTVWDLTGASAAVVQWLFLLSWGALIYSLSLTGLGYQTGLTQWWAWLRNVSLPRRGVPTAGAYQWVRHPVYLSFMGLIWFTPRMTLDHVVLTAVWTAYLLLGSYLKDERLAFYLGESYRAYQRTVPGFSLLGNRLLGRSTPVEDAAEAPAGWPLKLKSPAAAPVEKAA